MMMMAKTATSRNHSFLKKLFTASNIRFIAESGVFDVINPIIRPDVIAPMRAIQALIHRTLQNKLKNQSFETCTKTEPVSQPWNPALSD